MLLHLLQDEGDEFRFDISTSSEQTISFSPVESKQLKNRLTALQYPRI